MVFIVYHQIQIAYILYLKIEFSSSMQIEYN